MYESEFWAALDKLVETSAIVIDRPKGSAHPRFPHCIYPLDYGYLAGTTSMDGGGIDVWRGSHPEQKLSAIVCTVDLMKSDSEIKLLLGCTEEETQAVLSFHNDSGYMKGLLVRRFDEDCGKVILPHNPQGCAREGGLGHIDRLRAAGDSGPYKQT